MKQTETGGFVARAGEETLILSLDSSTETMSVAVVRGADVMSLRTGDPSLQQSSNLLSVVDAALHDTGLALENIDIFAVALGPGSFTGLRAGLATVKSFAATLGRFVVGVPTLHAVAYAAGAAPRVMAAIPAGRGELFAQLLAVGQGSVVELEAPSHVAPEVLLDRAVRLHTGMKWSGSGAVKIAQLIRERAALESIAVRDEAGSLSSSLSEVDATTWTLALPSNILAGHVAALARESFKTGCAMRAGDLQAIYVRPSDAELNEKCPTPNSLPK